MVADLQVSELTPRIGSAIDIARDELLSGKHASEIRCILTARGVICFPAIGLSDEEMLVFARTLGTISDESPTGIWKVSIDKSVNPDPVMADYQRSAFVWHFDGFERPAPYQATIITARSISADGGQTEIANAYAAYEDLPEEEKRQIEGLRVIHCFESSMRAVRPWPSFAELSTWQQRGTHSLPLVWTHRSGRKSLVLGASAHYVEGMGFEEGRALLCRLNEWATQPRYVYRHEWEPGDVILWDNTGTLHRSLPYAEDSGRLMHRTTLVGEEVLS